MDPQEVSCSVCGIVTTMDDVFHIRRRNWGEVGGTLDSREQTAMPEAWMNMEILHVCQDCHKARLGMLVEAINRGPVFEDCIIDIDTSDCHEGND